MAFVIGDLREGDRDVLQPEAAQELHRAGYTREQAEALQTPGKFKVSWLPPHLHPLVNLGGYVDDTIVGCIQLFRRADGTGVLEFLFVRVDYRDGGYARKLVREALRVAQIVGIEMIEVFAMEREPKAISFWEHLFQIPPNATGVLEVLDLRDPAQGWRLERVRIAV